MCLQSGLYRVTAPFLFLSQTLSKNLIRFTTFGVLFKFDSGLPQFEAGVGRLKVGDIHHCCDDFELCSWS